MNLCLRCPHLSRLVISAIMLLMKIFEDRFDLLLILPHLHAIFPNAELSKSIFSQVEDLVTAPSAETELLWLFKHALAGWPSTRELREELTPHEGVGGIGLRYKLLSAAIYLQVLLLSFNSDYIIIHLIFSFYYHHTSFILH